MAIFHRLSFQWKFVVIFCLVVLLLMIINAIGWFVIFLKNIFIAAIVIALIVTVVLHFGHKTKHPQRD